MKAGLKNAFMIGAMVVSWSIYYAVSKVMVAATGSPYLAGFLLRSAALLFLTARTREEDVLYGYTLGCDDYVVKPFRMQELLSRVRVLLRDRQAPQQLQRSGFSVDRERMQVLKDGEALPLTLTEYKILTLLMDRPSVVSRDRLLEILWDNGGKYIDDNTLTVHISRLREKVGAEHIRTIRGVGYQWSDTSSAPSSF